ncbi:MAG: hypothetical protein ACLUOI_12625 [Eisenbergiella sp.]
MHFEMDQEKDILVKVPHFTAPVLEVWIDGKSAGLIALPSYSVFGPGGGWAAFSENQCLWKPF